MQNYSGAFVTPIVIIALAAIAVVALGAWAVLGAECLTKEQARARHPGAWLYWHGSSRCWDNQRHATRQAPVPQRPAARTVSLAAEKSRPIIEEPKPNVAYPALIAGGGTSSNMLTPHKMSGWLPIADFDTDPPVFIPWQQRVVSQLQKE